MEINRFKKKPLMGILRGIEPELIHPLIDAVSDAGLETIEITMNTKGVETIIKQFSSFSNRKFMVGAGTVLNMSDLHKALDAGASFIVLPTLITEVVEYCAMHNIPVFPGALCPSEIYQAWNAGATMVKVFPANVFGPSYFKDVKAPFNNIELMACGGVSADNAQEYFKCGASAISFGGGVFKKEWLLDKKFDLIKQSIQKMVSILPE